MDKINILFVGPLDEGSTSKQRLETFKLLGHHVQAVNTFFSTKNWILSFLRRVSFRLGFCLDLIDVNNQISVKIHTNDFDLVWIEKGLSIKPDTLRKIKHILPSAYLVSYFIDDMLIRGNQSRNYLKSIPLYDVHLTTKSYNVKELKALGARDVKFFSNAYDSIAYQPLELSNAEKKLWGSDVAFLGGFQKARFESMLALAKRGVIITIWGPNWEPYVNIHPNLIIKPGWVLAENAAKVFCSTKINLCFLHKLARDLQTTRTMEIPACGAFMLAERTQEHQDLFTEGSEAEFFEDVEELLDKIKYYLGHCEQRTAIANAGYQRCLKSGYSYNNRLIEILNTLGYQ